MQELTRVKDIDEMLVPNLVTFTRRGKKEKSIIITPLASSR